jgi:beta-1,4-mannosyl-glycoprotein beta-1,4-N-acetylglucosaminyltransferase
LMALNDVVDFFVLVEANKTFTGNKKEFLFEKSRNLYKEYLDKIIYIKVNDAPQFDKSKDIWAIEHFQRNCIKRGLINAKNEDRIIISDVDEIPDPGIILKVKEKDYPITFNQYLFYYYVNCFSGRSWNGSIIIPFKIMTTAQEMRKLARKGTNSIREGGWHYSYMGGIEKIRSKLDNLSDAFTRIDRVGPDKDILKKIALQKDLWDEGLNYKLINIEENNYAPKCMKKFIQRYPHFYFRKN